MGEEEVAPAEGQAETQAVRSDSPRGLTPGMRTVLWAVGAIVAVGLGVAVWLLVTTPGSSATDDPQSSASANPHPTVTQGPVPGATPTTGSEVQPPEASAPPTDRLPPLPAQTPLVSEPLPASGSASGELVDGYPTKLMGPAPDSEVLETSISTEGPTMQVTLVARTDASPDDVRKHYRTLWASLGLTDAGTSSGADTAFSDSFSSLSLAFSSSGTGTVYMVFGVFKAN